MTPAEFRLVREVFEAALARRGPERDAALDRAGPLGDPVRARIESLLRDAETAGNFLETSAVPPSAALRLAESALVAEQDLLIGRRVGRYLVCRLIGAGGMGNVYQAQQDQPQRMVALKVIHPALAGRSSLRRFEYESETLARLRHPGIAQVYEAGTASLELDGRALIVPFFAMEFLGDAEPITAFARQRQLTLPQRMDLLAQVCDAVHHGHQRGVIHRDLKPANILVEPSGNPKVIDFGIARAAEADNPTLSSHTGEGQIVGTLAYMSPEQFQADQHEVDIRADVYALGVVLFELLAGVTPFDLTGKPIAEAALAIRERPPRRLSAIDPSLRGDVETIVEKATAHDRAQRYASAAQLADDLRRFLRSEPIAARPPSAVYQFRLFARRHKALVGATGAVAATLTLATVATSALAVFATRQAHAAEQGRARAVRVAEFLQGALGSANPYLPMHVPQKVVDSGFDHWADWRETPWPYCGKPGRAATPTDILSAAAARLDEAFADDPASLARVGTVVGRSLYNLSGPDHGLGALTEALAAARRAYGADHEVTIRAMLMTAECRGRWARDPDAVHALYREAVDSARRAFGPFDPRTLEAIRLRAYDMYMFDLAHKAAGDFLMEAVEQARAAGHADDPAVLRLESYAGYMYGWAGILDRAERLGRESLAAIIRVTGESSPLTAEARDQLGTSLRRKAGPHDEALLLTQQAADGWAAVFGADTYQAMGILKRVASFHEETDDWAKAADIYRRLAPAYGALLGEDRFEACMTRQSLAVCLYRLDADPAQRLELAESVIRSLRATVPPDAIHLAPSLWMPRLIALDARMALARPEAEQEFRAFVAETDAGDDRISGPLRCAVARYRLANRLIGTGSLDDAARLLAESRRLLAAAGSLDLPQGKELVLIEGRLERARAK